jgi:hypothetical protein
MARSARRRRRPEGDQSSVQLFQWRVRGEVGTGDAVGVQRMAFACCSLLPGGDRKACIIIDLMRGGAYGAARLAAGAARLAAGAAAAWHHAQPPGT